MDITNISVGLTRFIENENGESVPIPIEIQQILPVGADENLFLYYSNFFLNCAESLKTILVSSGSGLQLGNVPAFLYLHGLELYAKGKLYNLANLGKTTNDFGRHYGHKLNEIFDDLKKNGVNWDQNLTQSQLDLIRQVGDDYKSKLYNYADGISHSKRLKIDVLEISKIANEVLTNLG